MADPSAAASIAAAMRANPGLTQKQVGMFLGVSDRMVRQVLSGAKPGHNLAQAAGQLARHGVVTTPPVRRAQNVRTGPVGAPTAPVGPPVSARHSLGPAGSSQSAVDVPKRGLGKEAARKAITEALGARRGGLKDRGGQRVTFTITTKDGRQMTLGRKGGYDPKAVVRQMDDEGDPFEWIAEQATNAADGQARVDGDTDVYAIKASDIVSVSMTFA